ncbi:MAG: AAA family ATPase, partial [Candidatus Bathyarchaeia archaeon]
MGLREELREEILNRLRSGKDVLEGFYASKDLKESILAVLIAGRHLILEGPPGVGKTTLAKVIASLLPPMQAVEGCRYNCDPELPNCPDCKANKGKLKAITIEGKDRFVRVQGSPELMPEDLVGDIDPVMAMKYGIKDPRAFTPGKIQKAHRKILFIDELNRVPERTQSTLLQVLEEGVTTIAGFDIEVKVDTLVIATQNPEEYAGAERISETLSDRFERIKIGYPSEAHEIEILKRYAKKIPGVSASNDLISKIVRISQITRTHQKIIRPASVRASISTYEQAQALALLRNKTFVEKSDIEKAAEISLTGRIELSLNEEYESYEELLKQ